MPLTLRRRQQRREDLTGDTRGRLRKPHGNGGCVALRPLRGPQWRRCPAQASRRPRLDPSALRTSVRVGLAAIGPRDDLGMILWEGCARADARSLARPKDPTTPRRTIRRAPFFPETL